MLKLATKFSPQRNAFETAYQAGFRFTELPLNRELLSNWESIVGLSREYAMAYALHAPNCNTLDEVALNNLCDLYFALNCHTIVFHEAVFQTCGKTLSQMEPSLGIAVENHRLSPPEFMAWASKYQQLTLDIEHLWKFTLADAPLSKLINVLESFLKDFGHKLHHVHMPGYIPGYSKHRPMYCSREMVFAVLDCFAASKFDGFIVSETQQRYQNELELRMDLLLFEAWRASNQTIPQTSRKGQAA